MLKWLLLLGLLTYAGEYLLSPSNADLMADARRKQDARSELAALESACSEYASHRGELPAQLEDVARADAVDPWGHPYRYRRLERQRAELLCLGADGAEGGVGLDADLLSTVRAE